MVAFSDCVSSQCHEVQWANASMLTHREAEKRTIFFDA